MSLGKRERLGVTLLAAVAVLITLCGLTVRQCVPATSPLPDRTVVYRNVSDTAADSGLSSHRSVKSKRHARRKTSARKKARAKSRKNDKDSVKPRDYLEEPIDIRE